MSTKLRVRNDFPIQSLDRFPKYFKLSSSPIVFIDSSVDDYQSLAKGVISGVEVIILDSKQDGVLQITNTLKQRPNISSIHIVSHGSPGCLYLGKNQLSLNNLNNYAVLLKSWFSSSFPFNKQCYAPASILLYGCNVAAGDAGTEFVEKIHKLTGANIAAPKLPTGNAAKGGNWELEIRIPSFFKPETLAFTPTAQKNYTGLLAKFVVNTTKDENNGSGKLSLREAIIAANSNEDKEDTIQLQAGQTYTLTREGRSEDNSATGDLDITNGTINIEVVGNKSQETTIDAGSIDRVFDVKNEATFNLTNLKVTGGSNVRQGGGIIIDSGSEVTIKKSTISGNSTSDSSLSEGGGIFNTGTLTIKNSTISNNTAQGDSFGGFGAGINSAGRLTVSKSTISNNTIDGTSTGGSAIQASGKVWLNDSIISNNTGSEAGIRSNGDVEVNGSEISNNSGDGITSFGGDLNLNGSEISGNSRHGIFYVGPESKITVKNSAIKDNSGGGIDGFTRFPFPQNTGKLTVIDSDISNNAFGINSLNFSTKLNNSVIHDNNGTGINSSGGKTEVNKSTIIDNDGNGISNTEGILVVRESEIANNSRTGIYNIEEDPTNDGGELTVKDSKITGNSTDGIFNYRREIFEGNIVKATISNTTISKNGVSGIASFTYPTTVNKSIISGNRGTGLENYGDQMEVNNSTIIDNSRSGIINRFGASIEVNKSIIRGNTTESRGGGIYNLAGRVKINDTKITENQAPEGQGGGIASSGDDETTTEVSSSIIAGNINSDVDFVDGSINTFVSKGDNLIGIGNATDNFNQPSDKIIGYQSPDSLTLGGDNQSSTNEYGDDTNVFADLNINNIDLTGLNNRLMGSSSNTIEPMNVVGLDSIDPINPLLSENMLPLSAPDSVV